MEYKTSQFGEIVFLKHKKIKHKRLERDTKDKNKVIFCFEDSKNRKKLTKNYYNHEGKLNDVMAFVDEIRHVKSLIHNFLKR